MNCGLSETNKNKLCEESQLLLRRYKRLKLKRTTRRGNQYLEQPDDKDSRWGISDFGGCNPISLYKAEQVISKMELWQESEA